jgi:hypothetical protein
MQSSTGEELLPSPVQQKRNDGTYSERNDLTGFNKPVLIA